VKRVIAELTKKGFKSPYLRNYVVARLNPVRFHKAKKGDTKPPMPIAQALTLPGRTHCPLDHPNGAAFASGTDPAPGSAGKFPPR